ncbi:MAG: glycosyltransferase family 4 protein [Chloroflexota bacterium]
MHVLFTNNTLDYLAGTELYVYDLAVELTRQGHRVTCFSLQNGLVAERLRDQGIAVIDDLWELEDTPDVIHAHHPLEIRLAAARFPLVPLVAVSHGITHPLERPGDAAACVTRYIGISEEVREHLLSKDGVAADLVDVVPNFVDFERFTARRAIGKSPERVLVVSNHFREETTKATIERACQLAGGLELRAIGAGTTSVWEVEEHIDWADVVIGLGRSSLQAMAMGRAVVIFDYRGGDGLVTAASFADLVRCNFSGRTYNRQFSAEELASEIRRYDKTDVERVQALVRAEHSVAAVSVRLLAVYQKARGEFACTWPENLSERKRQETVRALARLAASQRDLAVSMAHLRHQSSWKDLKIESLTRELTHSTGELTHLTGELARSTGELAQKDDLLRRLYAGRVMRLLIAGQKLVNRVAGKG